MFSHNVFEDGTVQYKLSLGEDSTKRKVIKMGESMNTGFLYILTQKVVANSNLTLGERKWGIDLFEIRQDSGLIN